VRLAKFTATRLRGPFRATPALQSLLSRWWPDAFVRRPVDMTRAATEYAEAFLRYTREQPFALWVHYFDPHGPYDPPAEYRDTDGPWPRFPPADYHTKDFLEQWRWIAAMPEEHRAYVRSLYEGEIEYMDAGVGRILDALDRNGLVDNTYVVFSSDHGEEFWDHEKWEHGHSLFQDQIHVPLIVRGPGISRAAVETPVSAIDVLPTVRDWLDLPRLTSARGSSMADALAAGNPIASTPIFAQSTSFYSEPLQTVIDGHAKAIYGTDSGEWRLFDLERDPAERNDLSTEAPDELARLQERMETWRQSFPVTFDRLQTGADDSRLEEFEEMLKSMGYVN
jgi:arylsulfatase A-like enzyme